MFAVYARRQLSTFRRRNHVRKYLTVRRFLLADFFSFRLFGNVLCFSVKQSQTTLICTSPAPRYVATDTAECSARELN